MFLNQLFSTYNTSFAYCKTEWRSVLDVGTYLYSVSTF